MRAPHPRANRISVFEGESEAMRAPGPGKEMVRPWSSVKRSEGWLRVPDDGGWGQAAQVSATASTSGQLLGARRALRRSDAASEKKETMLVSAPRLCPVS